MMGLVLDGAFTTTHVFWWPFFGWAFPGGGLPELHHGLLWLVGTEVLGAAALAWCWREFGWSDPANRQLFWQTGHLNRQQVR